MRGVTSQYYLFLVAAGVLTFIAGATEWRVCLAAIGAVATLIGVVRLLDAVVFERRAAVSDGIVGEVKTMRIPRATPNASGGFGYLDLQVIHHDGRQTVLHSISRKREGDLVPVYSDGKRTVIGRFRIYLGGLSWMASGIAMLSVGLALL